MIDRRLEVFCSLVESLQKHSDDKDACLRMAGIMLGDANIPMYLLNSFIPLDVDVVSVFRAMKGDLYGDGKREGDIRDECEEMNQLIYSDPRRDSYVRANGSLVSKMGRTSSIIREYAVSLRLKGCAHVMEYDYISVSSIYSQIHMERLEGDLASFPLKSVTEQELFGVIRQIYLAIGEVHSCGFLHNDVKPDNFLYRLGETIQVKLSDFELSTPTANPFPVLGHPEIFRLPGGEKRVQHPFNDVYAANMTVVWLIVKWLVEGNGGLEYFPYDFGRRFKHVNNMVTYIVAHPNVLSDVLLSYERDLSYLLDTRTIHPPSEYLKYF